MRMLWTKSKGEQLDLLDGAATASLAPVPLAALGIDACGASEQSRATASDLIAVDTLSGQSHVVPIERLCEDPDNPRTEFPEARIDELAEDIRQHGILQPIVVHAADASGRYRVHFGAMRLRAARRSGLLHVPIVSVLPSHLA